MADQRSVHLDGFVRFNADYAKAGDPKPFRWVRGKPQEYGDDYVKNCIAQVPINFTLPEGFHPTAAMVAALEAERETVKRQFTARIAEINQQIGKLQAITNEVQQ